MQVNRRRFFAALAATVGVSGAVSVGRLEATEARMLARPALPGPIVYTPRPGFDGCRPTVALPGWENRLDPEVRDQIDIRITTAVKRDQERQDAAQ